MVFRGLEYRYVQLANDETPISVIEILFCMYALNSSSNLQAIGHLVQVSFNRQVLCLNMPMWKWLWRRFTPINDAKLQTSHSRIFMNDFR